MTTEIGWPKPSTGMRLETHDHPAIPALAAAGMGDVVLVVIAAEEEIDVPAGTELVAQWTTGRGLHTRPGLVLSVSQGAEQRWRVKATGPTSTDQRRRYTRAEVAIPVEIDTSDVILRTTTLDLSEGGMRCVVKTHRPLPKNVVVRAELEGEAFKIPSRIVRERALDNGTDLSIAFTAVPAAAADRLRRAVFSTQVRHRRLGVA